MSDGVRWTREQAAVLISTDNGLLSANAGTGKTTTIVGKILWMLGLEVGRGEDGEAINPCPNTCRLDEIAAITFTEKAACELKEKLRLGIEDSERADELRWELDSASVGTIHGFCSRLLRDHALRLGIDPSFRVLDERETTLRRHEIIREVVMEAIGDGGPDVSRLLKRFKLYDGQHTHGLIHVVDDVLRDIRWHADRYASWMGKRTSLDDPAALDLARIASLVPEEESSLNADGDDSGLVLAGALYSLAHRALARWLSWMEEENVRDFDSLILDARRLLTRPEHRPALEAMRRQLRILVVDEFQDTDGAQQDIAFALGGIGEPDATDVPQLLFVGDPKQSIYRFRGADVGVWNNVRDVICGDEEPMRLTANFRTQPGVVGFINRVCSSALAESAADVAGSAPELAVEYSPLDAKRPTGPGEGVDWLDTSVAGGKKHDREALEARLVVSRIRGLLASGRVADPAMGDRAVQPRDIAVLSRKRVGLDLVRQGLREAGIGSFNGASLGLSSRQEVIDLVTVLRLFADPEDDYHGYAFLRSPFVGLRDETIARFRLDPGCRPGSLIRQAAQFLARVNQGEAEWFGAPESPEIEDVERESLRRALIALELGQGLVDRVAPSELLEDVVQQTGYRLHLLLRSAADEALASIERFQALLDEYRRLPLAGFLELWDRWGEQDLGIPQAPLNSSADNVVTLQTIHTAKGLEWPIVFLVRAGESGGHRAAGKYLCDPNLGPILMPNSAERGVRASTIAAREEAAERAEEARLQYVALTRARDRLVIAGPADGSGYMTHIGPGLAGAVLPHLVSEDRSSPSPEKKAGRALAEDPITRTGGQIEVFDRDGRGQLDIFQHTPRVEGSDASASEAGLELVPVVYRVPDPVQGSLNPVPVSLDWLSNLTAAELPPLAEQITEPLRSRLSSATEEMLRSADEDAWRLRYVHGVEEPWRFAPESDGKAKVPAHLRGTLIHGVLERIQTLDQLAAVLNQTISSIDSPPGVEELLRPGREYREALEEEIAMVVSGDDWSWYVEGEHHRELQFLHIVGPKQWRIGAIDLYRPATETASPCLVDFKTHEIGVEAVPGVAAEYLVQLGVYSEAVAALAGVAPRTLLHFTHPNVAWEPQGTSR
jgi:ATP-dependent helicase/nuclease subunit A